MEKQRRCGQAEHRHRARVMRVSTRSKKKTSNSKLIIKSRICVLIMCSKNQNGSPQVQAKMRIRCILCKASRQRRSSICARMNVKESHKSPRLKYQSRLNGYAIPESIFFNLAVRFLCSFSCGPRPCFIVRLPVTVTIGICCRPTARDLFRATKAALERFEEA